jgi:hypothetical protein
MEQANKIQNYETRNVFKSDVVVVPTFVLVIDGNPMVTSFPSRKRTSNSPATISWTHAFSYPSLLNGEILDP